jgi:ATP-dependent exoDNAse (exonuclease V) alpha subunit
MPTSALSKALAAMAALILVGDVDQLPSVGPGAASFRIFPQFWNSREPAV